MSLIYCPSSWFPLSRLGQCCDFGGGQYFGHPMQRTDSLEKTLMLGKTEGRRRWRQDNNGRDSWMASLTLWTWVWASSGSWWWIGKPGVLQSMGSQRIRHNWATELNWVHALLHHVPSITPPKSLAELALWFLWSILYVSFCLLQNGKGHPPKCQLLYDLPT